MCLRYKFNVPGIWGRYDWARWKDDSAVEVFRRVKDHFTRYFWKNLTESLMDKLTCREDTAFKNKRWHLHKGFEVGYLSLWMVNALSGKGQSFSAKILFSGVATPWVTKTSTTMVVVEAQYISSFWASFYFWEVLYIKISQHRCHWVTHDLPMSLKFFCIIIYMSFHYNT